MLPGDSVGVLRSECQVAKAKIEQHIQSRDDVFRNDLRSERLLRRVCLVLSTYRVGKRRQQVRGASSWAGRAMSAISSPAKCHVERFGTAAACHGTAGHSVLSM